MIYDYKVLIISSSLSSKCTEVKELFKKNKCGDEMKVIEIDLEENGKKILKVIQKISGQKGLPNTFVNGEHIGNHEDVMAANVNGMIAKLLNEG